MRSWITSVCEVFGATMIVGSVVALFAGPVVEFSVLSAGVGLVVLGVVEGAR